MGLVWRIGNGENANFWNDNWSSSGILNQYVSDQNSIDINDKVSVFLQNGQWNIPRLNSCLPSDVVSSIVSIPISQCNQEDKLIWSGTSNGIFSVKSAYQIHCTGQNYPDYGWQELWSLQIPPKLKIFAWLLVQSKLLTNVQRFKRKITHDPFCHFCPNQQETTLHLFRDCTMAKKVWQQINGPAKMLSSFTLDWNGWIAANIRQKNCVFKDYQWNCCFIFCCWFIWKWRCKRIFEPSFCLPFDIAGTVFAYMHEWSKANYRDKIETQGRVEMLSWCKPAQNFFKVNVDGSKSRNGAIGAGGVIRDDAGNWISGFMINIGAGDVLQAEAWGLYHGLLLALNLKIQKIEIESDSAILVDLLQTEDSNLHPLGTLLENCKSIMKVFNNVHLCHIYRERNWVADILAKHSTTNSHGLCILRDPPAMVIEALLDDISGFARPRKLPVMPN